MLQIVHGHGRGRRRAVPRRRRQGRVHRFDRDRQEGDGGLRRDAHPGADRGRRQGRDDRRRRRRHRGRRRGVRLGRADQRRPDLPRRSSGCTRSRRSTTRSSPRWSTGPVRLTVGSGEGADIGPITMPRQIDVIRRHIDDALARGGRAVLGGPDAVEPPFVTADVLVDVPEDSAAVREETFGPTLTIKQGAPTSTRRSGWPTPSRTAWVARSSASAARDRRGPAAALRHGLGQLGDHVRRHVDAAVRRRRRLRLRPHPRRRRPARVRPVQGDHPPPRPVGCCTPTTFERTPAQVARIAKAVKMLYGRSGR